MINGVLNGLKGVVIGVVLGVLVVLFINDLLDLLGIYLVFLVDGNGLFVDMCWE